MSRLDTLHRLIYTVRGLTPTYKANEAMDLINTLFLVDKDDKTGIANCYCGEAPNILVEDVTERRGYLLPGTIHLEGTISCPCGYQLSKRFMGDCIDPETNLASIQWFSAELIHSWNKSRGVIE